MNVDFYSEFNPLKTLEIKDIGKCAIEGVNPDGFYFYLVIITVRGVAHMFTCGPLIPDLDDLPPGYTVNYSTTNFNSQKLKKTVSAWLNGRKPGKSKLIDEAKLVDIDYAISQASIYNDFTKILTKMGYELNHEHNKMSIRKPPYKRYTRVERTFGEEYSRESILFRIKHTVSFVNVGSF